MAAKKTTTGGRAGKKPAAKPRASKTGTTAKTKSPSRTAAKQRAARLRAARLRAGTTGIALLDNFIAVMKKFTVVEGRASRREFWLFVLAGIIIGVMLGALIFVPLLGIAAGIAASAFGLVTAIPAVTAGVRRLHDTNKTGWLMLLLLLPLIGWIIVLVLCAMKGNPGKNKYGPKPA
jgi:uncharacterized membrane protein YhaH (DUF805 family)